MADATEVDNPDGSVAANNSLSLRRVASVAGPITVDSRRDGPDRLATPPPTPIPIAGPPGPPDAAAPPPRPRLDFAADRPALRPTPPAKPSPAPPKRSPRTPAKPAPADVIGFDPTLTPLARATARLESAKLEYQRIGQMAQDCSAEIKQAEAEVKRLNKLARARVRGGKKK